MFFDRALLQEHDAVLLHKANNAQILETLTYFTVPMIFFNAGAQREHLRPDEPHGTGSGVLVQIDDDQHFILTAGHCVRQYQHGLCALGVDIAPHAYIPERWPSGFICDGSKDYGYIVVPPTEAVRFTAGNRLFAKAGRISVADTAALIRENDWMVLAGYPDATAQRTARGTGLGLFVYPTIISGIGPAPASTLESPSLLVEHLDLWVPKKGVDPANDYRDLDVPILRGASGGGCWRAGVRDRGAGEWSPARLRVSGIHIGSSPGAPEHRFARQVLLGHHLRLIAEELPSIRETIFTLWPALQEDRWAPR